MSFLSPFSALIAAAAAVPLLLLLYFLRLRRQRIRIPSTLLWQKSFEDLQANAPFQRLRWSILLVLQLLLLTALLLALAQPMFRGKPAAASRMVLLIDCSASMNARLDLHDKKGAAIKTRLDAARDTARDVIKHLGEAGQPSQMMIVAFGASAQVITPFESNRGVLLDSVDAIGPTDEQSNLDAALQLAGAFAGTSESGDDQPPDVVLLSDGCVGSPADSSSFTLRSGNFRFVQICPQATATPQNAPTSDNVGIASFSVRRELDDPARVFVFARLVNAGAQSVDMVVTLFVDAQPAASIRKTIPAAGASGPGEETLTHALDLPGGAVLTLRQNHADDLPADDQAAIVVPPPARPRIVLVHPDDSPADQFTHDLLAALEPQSLQDISNSAYLDLDAQRVDSGSMFDLVVFDRISAARLPGVPSLTIGGVPAPLKEVIPTSTRPGLGGGTENRLIGQSVLSWDRQHPVMRNVSLDSLVFAGFNGYELPAGATPLAFGPGGPIMAVVKTRGARHIAVGFQMIKSNWPVHISSAIFMQNALEYLTLAESGQNGLAHQPGEPITVRVAPEAKELVIDGPTQARLGASPGAMVTLPILHRAGFYTVRGAAPPNDHLALSVLSDVESDIRPKQSVAVNSESAAAQQAADASPQPLWPWLIAAALVLLIVEWLIYCRRVHG